MSFRITEISCFDQINDLVLEINPKINTSLNYINQLYLLNPAFLDSSS